MARNPTILALILAALVGCVDADVSPPTPTPAAVAAVEVGEADFGRVTLGESGDAVVNLRNTGDVTLYLEGVEPPPGIEVLVHPGPIAPGGAGQFLLRWSPGFPGMYSGEVPVTLVSNLDPMEPVPIVVRGEGDGPLLIASLQQHDFGEVDVGCVEHVVVTLTNTGNQPLDVQSVALVGDQAFSVVPDEALMRPLEPFTSREVRIRYAPRADEDFGGTLVVRTSAGEARVETSGRGRAEDEGREVVALGGLSRPTTILIHANSAVIPGNRMATYWGVLEPFKNSLQVFFETLQATGADYRLGVIWAENGTLDGAYLTEATGPRESYDHVFDVLLKRGTSGDNDASLRTLSAAVERNKDWLFEDDRWIRAPLHLIAINPDDEQSGIPYSTAMDDVDKIKLEGPVVWHAIAGPPDGCGSFSGSGARGDSFYAYIPAIEESGGLFQSVCSPDWGAMMEKLALAVAPSGAVGLHGNVTIPLRGTPVVQSVELRLDDARYPGAWEYDERLNAIVLEGRFLPDGEQVEVLYRSSTTCGG